MRRHERSAAVSETSRSSAAKLRRPGQAACASDSQGSAAGPEDGTQPRSDQLQPRTFVEAVQRRFRAVDGADERR